MRHIKSKYFLIFICISFILLIQWPVIQAATTKTTESTIGNVNIEDYSREEIQQLLESKVSTWLDGEPLLIKGEYEQLEIPRDAFVFDIIGTLGEWERETNQKWYSFLFKEKQVQLPLNVTLHKKEAAKLPERIDKKRVVKKLEDCASLLDEQTIVIDYLPDEKPELEQVASVELDFPGEVDINTTKLANELDKTIIEPKQEFALLNYAEKIDYTKQTLESLAYLDSNLDFYATALYELVLQTDLNIVEHHSQGKIPSYGKEGIEARVNMRSNKDLKVFNASDRVYELRANIDYETLKLSLHSMPRAESYEYILANTIEIPPRTVYRYSKALAPGEETIVQTGEPGIRVQVFRNRLNAQGELIDEELIEQVSYPARPLVKLVATEAGTIDDTIENPLGDFEKWMEMFLVEGDGAADVDGDVFDSSELLDELNQTDESGEQLPTIDAYVADLLDTYCESTDEEQSETVLEEKKNYCAEERELLREQLVNYLILESIFKQQNEETSK